MARRGVGEAWLPHEAGCLISHPGEGEPVPEPGNGVGIWFYQLGALLHVPPPKESCCPSPHGPGDSPTPTPFPTRARSHRPLLPLQKYIAQVLQDSEVDGDGGPGSSGDEPPSSSSQDEELLMQPDGLTDTDFQSCEDSLIENEIRQ